MNQQIDLTIMKQKICYFSLEMLKHFSNKVKKNLRSSVIGNSGFLLWLSGALLLISLAQDADVEGRWQLLSLDNDLLLDKDLFLFRLSLDLVLNLCLIEGDLVLDLCLIEGDLQRDICLTEGDLVLDIYLIEGDLHRDILVLESRLVEIGFNGLCIFLFPASFCGTSRRLVFPEEKQDNKLGKYNIKYIAQNKTIFNLEVTMRPSTRV